MGEVFLKILNMSIAAGWMILAVIIVRFLLKKVPKSFRCILWGMVGFRLIFPFSIESILSLIPSNETIAPEIIYSSSYIEGSNVANTDLITGSPRSEVLVPMATGRTELLQFVIEMAGILWLTGIVIMLGYALISYWRLHRRIKTAIRVKSNIWLCDHIDSPFVLGLIDPRIYIPSDLEPFSLNSVVAHEKAHIKRHDHWWKPLGFMILSVYWFNPFVWIAYILFCRDIEWACDEHVVKNMNVQEKKEYSRALLSCSIPQKMIAVSPLAFGEVGVKARIKSVLKYKKPTFWLTGAAMVVCIGVAVCFLTNPSSDDSGESLAENDMTISTVTSEIEQEEVTLTQIPTITPIATVTPQMIEEETSDVVTQENIDSNTYEQETNLPVDTKNENRVLSEEEQYKLNSALPFEGHVVHVEGSTIYLDSRWLLPGVPEPTEDDLIEFDISEAIVVDCPGGVQAGMDVHMGLYEDAVVSVVSSGEIRDPYNVDPRVMEGYVVKMDGSTLYMDHREIQPDMEAPTEYDLSKYDISEAVVDCPVEIAEGMLVSIEFYFEGDFDGYPDYLTMNAVKISSDGVIYTPYE